jgi:hypothetical protein
MQEANLRYSTMSKLLLYFGLQILCSLGPDGVRELIETAELYPIRGLFQFSNFFKELDDYYFLRLGDERGVSTGWRGLDDIYRVGCRPCLKAYSVIYSECSEHDRITDTRNSLFAFRGKVIFRRLLILLFRNLFAGF